MKSLYLLTFLCCISLCFCATKYPTSPSVRRPEVDLNSENEVDTGDLCSLPLVTGHCRALFYRYGYDNSAKKCVKFIYGGCRGNANNFKRLEDCEKACVESNTPDLGEKL